MAAVCNYHPGTRATHKCDRCQRNFCMTCFPGTAANPAQWRERSLRCPICRRALTAAGPLPFGQALRSGLGTLARTLRQPASLLLLGLATAVSLFLPLPQPWLLPIWTATPLVIGLLAVVQRRRSRPKLAPPPRKEAPGVPAPTGGSERENALARIRILTIEGDYNAARRVLMDALRQHNSDPELNERYYRLLLTSRDAKALRELAPHLLEKLVRVNRAHKAAKYYLATLPRPVIDKSHLRHALAESLFRQRKFHEAAQLLKNLHRDDADYRRLDSAYLLLARIYLEGLKRSDDAARLLHFLRRQFPHSPLTPQVQALQKRMESAGRVG